MSLRLPRPSLAALLLVVLIASAPGAQTPAPAPPGPLVPAAPAPPAAPGADAVADSEGVGEAKPAATPAPPPAPAVPAAAAGGPTRVVRDVRLAGNLRLDRETILYYTTLKPGSAYDPEIARADFRKLWETGLFEDLELETEEVPDGLVLVWKLSERPVLSRVEFKGNDGVSTDDIKARLKEKGIEFRETAPFGLGQVERARGLIEDLHHEKGYRFASVKAQTTPEEAGVAVTFETEEGSKVRIARIEFEGNVAFSDDKLRDALKKTREESFFCFIGKKCVFNDANFKEDKERLQDFYYDRGYVNFDLGEEVITAVGEGKKRRLEIKLPVREGKQYRVGQIQVEGNTAYSNDLLLRLNQLEKGKPFSRRKMNESRREMSDLYGIKGYFNVFIQPTFDRKKDGDVVDVTYKITENELYYIHRIAFRGNTSTKDKVIRRQMKIAEGDLFNTARFKRSLFRIYQLGYFKEPEPKVEPSKEEPTRLDVTIDLQEEGRNDVRLGGGYSGVEGFFGTFAFATRNLFGSGNSLTVDIAQGKRIKQYLVSYLDPFIFDRPVSGGIDIFNRYSEYTDFERRGTGGQVQLGVQVADFWFLRSAYRYEEVDQEPRERFDAEGNPLPLDPDTVARFTDHRRVSSLNPVMSFSNIDNPVRPWSGFRQVTSLEYSGGFLGGTTNIIKPRIAATGYLPLNRRVNLGLNGEVSWVRGFGGQEVPLFERFFLGGEQSIRGYTVYHVSPTTQDIFGNDVLLGGNKMMLMNAELQFKVASPVSLVLFGDAGNAFNDDEDLSFTGLKTSFGAEIRFWTPFLQAPLRLIYSYVPEPLTRNGVRDPKTNFTFSIGTTF